MKMTPILLIAAISLPLSGEHCADIHAGDTVTAFCQHPDGSGDLTFVGRFGSIHWNQDPALMTNRLRHKSQTIKEMFLAYSMKTLSEHPEDYSIPVELRDEERQMLNSLPSPKAKP